MALEITFSDRTDSGTPAQTTSEVTAAILNEIKIVVNSHAAEIDQLIASVGTLETVTVSTSDPHTLQTAGLKASITIEDGGTPLPVGGELYTLDVPASFVATDDVRIVIANENPNHPLTITFNSGWKTSNGSADRADETIPTGGVLIVKAIAVNSTELWQTG